MKCLPKKEWLKYKEEFKNLKKELFPLLSDSSRKSSMQVENFCEKKEGMEEGCLLKVSNVPSSSNKEELRIALSQYCSPSYVDYRKGSNYCNVRFASAKELGNFLKKYSSEDLYLNQAKVHIFFRAKIKVVGLDESRGRRREKISRGSEKAQRRFS